mmetsp:Transcript_33200/g.66168  ORF Transcript_33200/g.66168 Transcript_33200/m.66168 type:complete len:317 (+) Transcript_33200:193-1143(+)|eukprot:CAMPEP_0171773700 /NCGR_PEP_ID=MMETSP0991-20121206/55443_1 /TAXON_ID=483369 /ORGANISM="non described non described, Strain CCMP2098" /LENGTH=316 /DNA_ID=CAMNT_0012379475 /DNA_START=116 /DNA_END=1066 /DNA_ORIENTATION=+
MFRLQLMGLGVGAASIGTAVFSNSASALPLASTVSSPARPTTILIHGLDSSKQTWSAVLSELQREGYPAFAIDLRGHGESKLGDPSDFSPGMLARDVAAMAKEQQRAGRRFVVVGHSMGGRIAMRLAADSPGLVAALVVEDMCVTPRVKPAPHTPGAFSAEALAPFGNDANGRLFEDFAAAKKALLPWYDGGRIDSWKGLRIREQPAGGWFSDINPLAANLARDTVLGTADGREAWMAISVLPVSFPVHLWVADRKETVCFWDGDDGIQGMAKALPAAEVREFPGSAHSIHNTAPDFTAALMKVIDDAAAAEVCAL